MPDRIPDPRLDALAEVLRTLGHDTRLRLIATLLAHGEKSVGEIEALTGIGQPGLSQQLGVLRKGQLVQTRRAAKQVYYSIASDAFAPAAAFLAALARTGPTGSAPRADRKTGSPARGSAAMFAKIL
ncbi:MAG: metalloregulator ArsR/SmtB family transcription factor [Alphaproteobacteria bacterium]|nr:metalloregulator ArsR/SmtB family transcription factor [Alphaproteobacteria bacterium]MBU0774330.1 metalloregulator ArsR/SmtB family transcription factor [Alphaproteobacteria bacterium]MBU0867035.1 metalloregulator ArsR/SmtB family transcription factor [Alphaproteobacteria bacterium]MBU1796236.1 metalloregulator ArsR/SmtB family transcription factor [Alphaproteobacteria bacterium]